ncbi:MAG: 3-hydroxybutyryl-CoA dehydrogenase [candidate division Zixibacteria bacterium]|nr:3-hydroxybutyryl-CoA dehydrogenase [candidate division Zixibacteria bacterium]
MIKKVGVIGIGQMGAGIAQVSAQAGYSVIINDISDELLQRGIRGITKLLDKAIEKGKLDQAGKDKILANIKATTELAALSDCDIVIEAATENMAIKKEIFAELDKACKAEAIFATNTSSLPVGDLAASLKRRGQFVGLHFFNPVPVMKLVEVVKTLDTADETFKTAKTFAESIGKTTVSAKDTPGFVVNALLIPYLLDAIRQYENELATREDIDNAMVLGCGHPMGPLTLTDFIGLDTTLYIADIMYDEFKDSHYAAPPLLRRMVNAGYLGKKSGHGFYDYSK